MQNFVTVALIIFGALALLAIILYIPKLVQFSFFSKKMPRIEATEKRRISLVIPARDESEVICDLLDSIAKQTYDKNYFSVNIIVKDKNDATIAIAKAAGANVFIVPEQTCKGEALDGYFQALSPQEVASYAAFAIIDADAVLSPDYVAELNNALEHDYQIFMTRKSVKNYFGGRKARSIFCNCSALNYPAIDELGAYYRQKKGAAVNFCGQGMLVRSEVIAKIGGWPYRTLTEDYELRLDSILHGFTSAFYPHAVLYTEEVLRHKDAYMRRLRWLIGYSQCDKKYKKRIREKLRNEKVGFFARYDYFFALVPLMIFAAATIVTAVYGAVLSIYFACVESSLWLQALLCLVVLPLGAMYGLELCHCVLLMIAYRDALAPLSWWEKLVTLLYAPLFMFEYFPLFVQAHIYLLTKKQTGWLHTKRVIYHSRGGIARSHRLRDYRALRKEERQHREEK